MFALKESSIHSEMIVPKKSANIYNLPYLQIIFRNNHPPVSGCECFRWSEVSSCVRRGHIIENPYTALSRETPSCN